MKPIKIDKRIVRGSVVRVEKGGVKKFIVSKNYGDKASLISLEKFYLQVRTLTSLELIAQRPDLLVIAEDEKELRAIAYHNDEDYTPLDLLKIGVEV